RWSALAASALIQRFAGWQPLLRCILAGNQGVAGLRPVRAPRRRLLRRGRQRRGPRRLPLRVGARGPLTTLHRPPRQRIALCRRVPPHVARRPRSRSSASTSRHAARRAGADLPIYGRCRHRRRELPRPRRHRQRHPEGFSGR
uniref:Uncharacterized protein n=1 Tax=Triticum urartu TaxID=4572 RepID=A0A8R7RA38_TRIUA